MKIRPAGAELFHADGRTDMTKLLNKKKIINEDSNFKPKKNKLTSSVYDCTVEDVEYIYNKLSI